MEEVHEWILILTSDGIHRVYLRQAYIHAQAKSEDAFIQNGALIISPSSGIIAADVNRYASLRKPPAYGDTNHIEHAERAVIYRCVGKGLTTLNTHMYCTSPPCLECARAIIMSGISRVISHKTIWDRIVKHSPNKCDLGILLLKEVGVEFLLYDGKVLNSGEFTIRSYGESIEP